MDGENGRIDLDGVLGYRTERRGFVKLIRTSKGTLILATKL